MSIKTAGPFTVSGPGVDKSFPESGPALSVAITRAERHAGAASFYVRDAAGGWVYRVDHFDDGSTVIRCASSEKAVA